MLLLKMVFEYLLFVTFIIVFFISLLTFDLIQRFAAIFGRKGIEFSEYLFNSTLLLCLRITGAKINFSYEGDMPTSGPAVIISNHQSMFDIPLIFVALHKLAPRFVSKKELAKGIPGVSTCLRLSKAALIDRKDPSQAIPEIKRFAKFIKEIKMSAVIFPEGTRAKDGKLKPFKTRGSEILTHECLPCSIIPLAIEGAWNFQRRKHGPIPFRIKVRVHVFKPIHIKHKEDVLKALNTSEELIKNKILELRHA